MRLSDLYKALADDSRLRILRALRRGYLNVQELTAVLGTTQSTVSHHLKILLSAHLLRTHREGTRCYYGLAHSRDDVRNDQDSSPNETHTLLPELLALLEQNIPPGGERDDQRIEEILQLRRAHAIEFFEKVAPTWNALRSEAMGGESFLDYVVANITPEETLVDLGCGTGALLERLLPRPGITIAVDQSPRMLDEARLVLGDRAGSADLRLGGLEHLPLADHCADVAVAYMVLHHVPTPPQAIAEAARVLRSGGRFLIVDLVRHDREFMRERYADLWLGFEPEQVLQWARKAGFAATQSDLLGAKREVFFISCIKQ